MKIDLANLPAEGEQLEGQIPPEIFSTESKDIISAGPLRYSLFAQRFDTELLLTGALEATFQLSCMRCLQPFAQTVSLPSAALSIEIPTDSDLDASQDLREEILIELPTIPRCEEGDHPGTCEIDQQYLAVDKAPHDEVDNAPATEKPNQWAALDALESPDQPS